MTFCFGTTYLKLRETCGITRDDIFGWQGRCFVGKYVVLLATSFFAGVVWRQLLVEADKNPFS